MVRFLFYTFIIVAVSKLKTFLYLDLEVKCSFLFFFLLNSDGVERNPSDNINSIFLPLRFEADLLFTRWGGALIHRRVDVWPEEFIRQLYLTNKCWPNLQIIAFH